MSKPRIEYIDIAKGICIILVVYAHIDEQILDHRIGVFFDSFRMPLYFFLSGLFFKCYSGWAEFAVKKFNRLVVPLFFFFLFAFLVDLAVAGIQFQTGDSRALAEFDWRIWQPLRSGGGGPHNPPLWFLTCLFEINLLYYLLHRRLSGRWMHAAVVLISVIGWELASHRLLLPYKMTSTLAALPFFHTGAVFRRAGWLEENRRRDIGGYLSILPLSALVWFIARPIYTSQAYFPGPYWVLYTAGIGGSLAILFLSKGIKRLPGVRQLGRYSLIVFGTHWPLLKAAGDWIYPLMGESAAGHLLVLGIVLACEAVLIPVGIRWFPRFTAQQELIPSSRFRKA